MLAPIVLFVYNRLEHTKKTIEALQRNEIAKHSDLIVYSDGAKDGVDVDHVALIRAYLRIINGFKRVRIVEREENYGLARSIISGVTEIIEQYEKIIVLEDDMVTSPFFLTYMNNALDLYESNEDVVSIHGYVYPVNRSLPETFFLKGADCWGWATWARGWGVFEIDGKKLLQELKNQKMTRHFDFGGTYPYTQMLEDQIRGRNNSWAIRWYASAFLAGKYTLYPGTSLVKNIGMDASGTHSGKTDKYYVEVSEIPVEVKKQPVIENSDATKAFAEYFERLSYNTQFQKIKFTIKKLLVWVLR
jgi:hypothetical protein